MTLFARQAWVAASGLLSRSLLSHHRCWSRGVVHDQEGLLAVSIEHRVATEPYGRTAVLVFLQQEFPQPGGNYTRDIWQRPRDVRLGAF
jgi:hypothetical protein